ncbi:MAG: hypothetical protein GY858_09945 [Candidatus Omnitrophica bacterium]|nr:hypothetical protein [Candidatus Omnitrophota bacterium]
MKIAPDEPLEETVPMPTVIKPNGNILLSYQLQIDSLKGTIGALQEERESLAGKLETANNLVSTLSEEADVQKYEALAQESKEGNARLEAALKEAQTRNEEGERRIEAELEKNATLQQKNNEAIVEAKSKELREQKKFQELAAKSENIQRDLCEQLDLSKDLSLQVKNIRRELEKAKLENQEQKETVSLQAEEIGRLAEEIESRTVDFGNLLAQHHADKEEGRVAKSEMLEEKENILSLYSEEIEKLGVEKTELLQGKKKLEDELKATIGLFEGLEKELKKGGVRESERLAEGLKLEKENKKINREKEELKERESNLEELRIKQEKELRKNEADLKGLGEKISEMEKELEEKESSLEKLRMKQEEKLNKKYKAGSLYYTIVERSEEEETIILHDPFAALGAKRQDVQGTRKTNKTKKKK